MTSPARRRPLGATLLVTGAVVLAVVGAPGTMAFLSAQATVPGATAITTGSAQLSISAVAAQNADAVHPGGPATRLHPTAAPLVINTGTVPLALSISPTTPDAAAPLARAIQVHVALQASPSCATTPPAGAWVGAVGANSTVLAVLVPQQSLTLCAWQQLPATASAGSQGQAAPLTLVLNGAQQ
ncbi:hypothetical protein [Microbacterium sp. NPDC055521]